MDRAQKGTQHQAIGRSRGGLTTTIVGMVDTLGNLFRFLLLPGQAHDMKGVAPLIHDVSFGALLADKAFDADLLLQDLDERDATAVIPPKSNRKAQRDYNTHMYKWRHLVENYFAKIKKFRGIATQYDKTDTSYQLRRKLVPLRHDHRRSVIVDRPKLLTGQIKPPTSKTGHFTDHDNQQMVAKSRAFTGFVRPSRNTSARSSAKR